MTLSRGVGFDVVLHFSRELKGPVTSGNICLPGFDSCFFFIYGLCKGFVMRIIPKIMRRGSVILWFKDVYVT